MRKSLFILSTVFLMGNVQPVAAQIVGDELCPDPQIVSKQTPNNLADIQGDIERFTLCIRRADLLNRLNRLAQENDEAMLNYTGSTVSIAPLPVQDIAAEIASIDLNGSDLEDLDASDEQNNAIWVIKEIYGVASNLRASLTNDFGEIVVVQKSDSLPDGYEVKKITSSSITLTKDGETLLLSWNK